MLYFPNIWHMGGYPINFSWIYLNQRLCLYVIQTEVELFGANNVGNSLYYVIIDESLFFPCNIVIKTVLINLSAYFQTEEES